jgi:hypothetical protein
VTDLEDGLPIQNQGVAIGQFTTVNFTGAGVAATDGGNGVANVAIPPTPPAGTDKTVQFNDGGVYGADPSFVFDKSFPALGIGTNAHATAKNAVAIGDSATASGEGSLCHSSLGLASVASGQRSVNLGAESMATNIGSVNIGHLNISNDTDAVTIGEVCSATGGSANAFVSGLDSFAIGAVAGHANGFAVFALGNYSTCQGLSAVASRAGQRTHGSGRQGATGCAFTGCNEIDLAILLPNGGSGKLIDTDGHPFLASEETLLLMEVEVTAATRQAGKFACEVWRMAVTALPGPVVTIGCIQQMFAHPSNGFSANGWSLTFAGSPNSLEWSITVDTGGDPTWCVARVRWSEMTNLAFIPAAI